MPQNGIKDEGMKALFSALKECESLQTLVVNDNWLKEGAAGELEQICKAGKLRVLNVSDCNIGQENVH